MARYHLVSLCLAAILCAASLTLGSTAAASPVSCHPGDRDALLRFLSPICSPNCRFTADCCSWEGAVCDNAGRVTRLYVSRCPENFTVSVESSLFLLRHLEVLSLTNCLFAGNRIPESLGKLENLKELMLFNLNLGGKLPALLGNLRNLEGLHLLSNSFTGGIPDSLRNLTKLKALDLNNNLLTGALPPYLYELPNLERLSVAYNNLDGDLPGIIRSDSRLKVLNLNNNKLTGKVPSWLFAGSLTGVLLNGNNFTGPIELPSIPVRGGAPTEVDLSNNQIRGSVPKALFQFTNISTLNLHGNLLSGVVEWSWLEKMTSLQLMFLGENKELDLRNSNNAAFNLPKLVYVDLSGCRLTKFPSFFSALESLTILQVSRNKMSGRLDFGHGWKSLQSLDASFNRFTSFSPPPSCSDLTLSHNLLAGEIPLGFADISRLDLSHNNYSGALPRRYDKLLYIDLSGNHFSGNIPSVLLRCLLQYAHRGDPFRHRRSHQSESLRRLLEQADRGNPGTIPRELINIQSHLDFFDVSYNQLEGRIPEGLHFASSSYLGNERLCGPPLPKQC